MSFMYLSELKTYENMKAVQILPHNWIQND